MDQQVPQSNMPLQATASSPTLSNGSQNNISDDEGASETSSVANNASIVSQNPDRYGFLGGDQYTHERYYFLSFQYLTFQIMLHVHHVSGR